MRRVRRKVLPFSGRYCSQQSGAAAVEFALILGLLAIPILNVMDFALYAWDRMQVDNAAQVAAQAVRTACPLTQLPATTKCPGMAAAVTLAAHSTSLGPNVTVTNTAEHYYCITSGGTLTQVATPPTAPPSDCSGNGGSANDRPGDYVLITTSYTYTPLFPAVSIVGSLPSPIVRQAWMRLL